MTFSADQQIELLRLRSVQFPPSPILSLSGPLVKKGSGRGRKREVELVQQIEEGLNIFKWIVPPRAKMEIEFHFFSSETSPPVLHKLVKYYMDLLKGRAFNDDRQVHYLEASRMIRPESEDKVYISFDRLARRKKRIGLYNRHKHNSFDRTDFTHTTLLDPAGIPTYISQYSILSQSKLEDWQQTGDPGIYRDYVRMIQTSDPFTISLGDLPRHGGTAEYKNRIRRSFQNFKHRYTQLQRLELPVELDLQVTPRELHLGKDLDNIAQDICPIFAEELLGKNGSLSAFRVYAVDQLPTEKEGGIWVKLLPMGSFLSQGARIRNVIEEATERISLSESW